MARKYNYPTRLELKTGITPKRYRAIQQVGLGGYGRKAATLKGKKVPSFSSIMKKLK